MKQYKMLKENKGIPNPNFSHYTMGFESIKKDLDMARLLKEIKQVSHKFDGQCYIDYLINRVKHLITIFILQWDPSGYTSLKHGIFQS